MEKKKKKKKQQQRMIFFPSLYVFLGQLFHTKVTKKIELLPRNGGYLDLIGIEPGLN